MNSKEQVLRFAGFIAKFLPSSTKQAIYRNRVLSNLIRKSLNRAAPEGMSVVRVESGAAQGIQMELDLQTEKAYWLGTYENEIQQAIVNLVKPGEIIYDIGANIGFLTLLFAKMTGPSGHVYAFEAFPENIMRLTNNIERNGFQNWTTVIPAAVLNKTGPVEFFIGPSTNVGKVKGSAGRDSISYEGSIQVEGISIDEYIQRSRIPPPNIIKLDIEGGEVLALPGMQELLKNHHPIVMIEIHGREASQVAWDMLRMEKYKICRIQSSFPEVKDFQDLNWKSYIVAFPND